MGTLWHGLVFPVRLSRCACVYRPQGSGLASLGGGTMADSYLRYLFSSLLRFYSGWACVIFIIGKKL